MSIAIRVPDLLSLDPEFLVLPIHFNLRLWGIVVNVLIVARQRTPYRLGHFRMV
jgi:hypothetical protein